MSIHKLTAGSGYDYLTRQVAAMDATEKGHTPLATYYTDHGETPGQWMGAGMAGIDGLDEGDPVTAEQMKALFGFGFHPLADSRIAQLADSASTAAIKQARQLGTPFKVYEADVPPFRIEVARRLEDLNVVAGRPREAVVSLEERARMRSVVAREYFVREHGREPADARELASAVALYSRPKTTAVAGYDLTFSPVKSVSALWAVADPSTSAAIERAHNAAVKDALAFIEREALYTRTGTNGVRQVDVRGMVATVFTHRDSRATTLRIRARSSSETTASATATRTSAASRSHTTTLTHTGRRRAGHPAMLSGRKKATDGSRKTMTATRMIMAQTGSAARKISPKVVSRESDFSTNRSMPRGGVIWPSSTSKKSRMPKM
ncbi:MobF family relaxase [Nocardioides sp. 31GB23]|uniref:MobF family relaxase n=1 Tax=Nocardioides sp. 31GB23 TaxID=3156065 RepID=UPI0032AF7811